VAKAVLVLLMFVGGSAGSTGGGIKVIRILIAFKVMLYELERAFRPQVVRPIKIARRLSPPSCAKARSPSCSGICCCSVRARGR
jgi:Trk-type K+ transport system membrane component